MRLRWRRPNKADTAPTPTISGISPSSGTENGSTSVTLTGTGFRSPGGMFEVSYVNFGTARATDLVVVSDTSITCTTPAVAAGAVNVQATSPGGTATLVSGYTFTGATVDGVQFSGSESFYAAAPAGTALGTARVRFRLDVLPASGAFEIIAGPNNGGSNDGWLVCLEDTYTGATVCQLTVYAGIGGVLTRIGRKFLMPSDVGRVFTLHITCDGASAFVYLDGKKIGIGTAAASITAGAQAMNLGARSGGTFSSQVTLLDVAEGSTALTPAEVATDAASSTPAFAGQTHRYVASAGITTTWNDEVGSAHLTAFGSPAPVSFAPTYGYHRGTVEIWGDSIAQGRQSGGSAGDGWRREVQRAISTSNGEAITFVGYGFPNAPTTFDYDYKNSAAPGEALNTRLATLAADLALYGPVDAATLFAYGINDIVALSRTAAQLKADITTAVGYAVSARPGRPVFVCNVMDVASGSASAPQHAEIASFQADFSSFITTLQGTYPTVRGIDTAPAVTDPDDVAVLYDGTHPTPATYTAMANIIAPAIAAAM